MARVWQPVRIFVSSTFRDMHSERDHLAKVVFPELRDRMGALNLHLVDIDLRWGVPEEEVEKGRVLDIVLEEIERARPFFVALLGERYGTVPGGVPEGTAKSHAWISEFPDHSITALEIVHGVLRNPQLGRKAFFYFRDPGLIAGIPPRRRADYTAEDARAEAKVRILKDRIRASGRPVMEGYPCRWDEKKERVSGLDVFGNRILEDLWQAIREEYPEGAPEPDPISRELRMQDAFAEERSRFFVGRRDLSGRLTEFVRGESRIPAVVTGQSGIGKSAFLSHWARNCAAEHQESCVLAHHIGASPESADHSRLLRILCGRLKRDFGLLEEIPNDDDKLPGTLGLMLLAASGRRPHFVVVVDGLDLVSSRGAAHGLNWLLDVVPERVRLIVSTGREDQLDILRRRGAEEIMLPPLSEAEREELVEAVLGEWGRRLSEAQRTALLVHPGAANPLYLRTALEELKFFGRFDQLTDKIEGLAPDVPGLFVQVLERLEEDHGRDLVAEVYSLIGCSRFGMAEAELLSLLDRRAGERFPRNLWARLRRSSKFYLAERGELIYFPQGQMAEAVCLRYSNKKSRHETLAAYFRLAPIDRKLSEYPFQLQHAEKWEELGDELSEPGLFKQALESNRDIEWMGYWRALEGRQDAWKRYREALETLIAKEGESEAAADLATRIGLFLHDYGDGAHPGDFFERALAIREKTLGRDSPQVALSLTNLGGWHYRKGEFLRAETELRRALSIYEKIHGLDQPALAATLNNLAELYRAQGRYDEAEPLYERTRDIQNEACGSNSPELARSLYNLARLRLAQGRFDEAEPLLERSAKLFERVQGAHHPALATCLTCLAALHQSRGRFSEAKSCSDRALALYTMAYGPEHPYVAAALNNMAMILRELGRYSEAESLYLRSVEIRKKTSGPNHPDLGQSLNNLAQLYQAQGRMTEAMGTFRQALSVLEKAWGPAHLEVGRCLNNLGSLYSALSRPADAERCLSRSIEIFEDALGPRHPDLARALNNMAQLSQAQGRSSEAESLYERSLDVLAESLGPEHLDVGRSLHNLAGFYQAQGKPTEAEILYGKALTIKEKGLGPDHPDVAVSLNNLGELYYDQGRFKEAETVFERALQIREGAYDFDHPELALSLNNLAWLYETQGRHAAAEPLFRRAVQTATNAFGIDHPMTAAIKENLKGCLTALRKGRK